ncbi:MAG: tyrosine-type recombinase/integrase [Eubacteriales bacterium]
MKNGKQELISATYKPPVGITAAQEEKEVKQFADLFEAAVHNGVYIPGMKTRSTQTNAFGLTVGEFIGQHYFKRIEKKLSPNTVRFYHSIAEQFIVPSYGNLRLSDITIKHQQAFVEYLSSPGARADENDTKPLSAATVKRYATVFSSVMTEACKMGFIDENKLKYGSVEYPKIVKKPIEVYTNDEARQFFEALQNEPPKIRLMLLCALLLGLRRGEIVALKWSDIDLRAHSLSVNKSVYKEKGDPQQLKAPKSQTSIRTVFFSDVLVSALEEWKEAQAEERASAGFDWKEQDFIFTNAVGDMISLYTPSRICSKFEEQNGLHHLKFHGLRHTCGSLMASNGVDPETVKTVLGHDSIETTNLYIHPYEKNMRKAAEILGNIVTK